MGWWGSNVPGGTPVHLFDGYDETQGLTTDTAWDGASSSPTIMSVLKAIFSRGVPGLANKPFDAFTYTATSATIDTYRYYTGGTGGTLQFTITVTWTDSTHATLSSVVRT